MSFKEVVVTGIGAVTPIGNIQSRQDHELVTAALLDGVVGIAADPDFEAAGFKSVYSGRVHGLEDWMDKITGGDVKALKAFKRYLGNGRTLQLALLPAIAAYQDAGLADVDTNILTFIGTGGPDTLS